MSIIDTALIYVGIPLAITAVLAFGVYGRSALHQPSRYRPGRPWAFGPVWFVPHPKAIQNVVTRPAIEESSAPARAVGGASGEW
jgi:hypothetical protein